jgi:glutamate synthase (NADPH/NADH) small chain
MPAYVHEYELAKGDGVAFEWLTAPLECVQADGRLTGLRMQRLEMQGQGRGASLVPVADSEFTLECDMVVKALGQQPLLELMDAIDGLEVDRGRLVVDPDSGVTSVAGLYAGGDCISKGAEVVNAVEEGKIAARGISDFLAGRGEG